MSRILRRSDKFVDIHLAGLSDCAEEESDCWFSVQPASLLISLCFWLVRRVNEPVQFPQSNSPNQ